MMQHEKHWKKKHDESKLCFLDVTLVFPHFQHFGKAPAENMWMQALRKVETHSKNFQELRCVGRGLVG